MYLLKERRELELEKERERAARARAKARKAKKAGKEAEHGGRKAGAGREQQKTEPERRQRKPKQPQTGKKKNHELAVVTYMFIGLFTLMIGYFVYFEAVLSEDVINNPYNSRQDVFAENVVRGSILASDGRFWPRRLSQRMERRHAAIPTPTCFLMWWAIPHEAGRYREPGQFQPADLRIFPRWSRFKMI